MHCKLRHNGFIVDSETVRHVLKALDPEGVKQRKAHRLRRRIYRCAGPNYMWHIDGYDKLKPFGFAIHGGIDGYSRKILWLDVAESNNDPCIVAHYFVKYINENMVVPRVIRADRGSENVVIGGIQRFLRHDHTDSQSGEQSFRFGPSTSNQRIESWWSQLRRSKSNWWMNFFKDMRDNSIFDSGVRYHRECIRFCFIGLLQNDLDEMKILWNNHRIRYTRNAECPAGRPNVIYFAPERFGGRNGAMAIDQSQLNIAKPYCKKSSIFGCSEEFLQLVSIIMSENNLSMPGNPDEARSLFEFLVQQIELL